MDPAERRRVVLAYHEQTKHHPHRYAVGPHELDWETQPDPFRRFEGAARVSLSSEEQSTSPPYASALRLGGVRPEPLSLASVGRLLFDSLSISAWKQVGEARWSLRVNPSSGNLHPTEAYVLLPAVDGVGERASVLHYAVREHELERRAELPADLWESLALPPGALLVGLTSIHWREAWKYGERAFRYCQHDVGHALAALAIAAGGLGWRVDLIDDPGTVELADLLGVFAQRGPEAERADLLLLVRTREHGGPPPDVVPAGLAARFRELVWHGRPNDLSPDHVDWDAVDLVAAATDKPRTRLARATPPPGPHLDAGEDVPLRPLVRQRRSCLALDARTSMRAGDFFAALQRTLPAEGRLPFAALPWSARIDLALFVHRVDGLEPGLYWLLRDPARLEALRAALRPEFLWSGASTASGDELPLFLLHAGDFRRVATQVSCTQAIGGDGAFSLGMIAEYERSLDEHGPWFYSRLFWEAGAIGQVLYLEAERVGLRSTGIGCFFDDPMHGLLGLRGRAFQSLYHFTVGAPVDDPRITTLPAYPARGAADGA